MKVIALTQGFSTIVDDTDYTELSRFKWHTHRCGKHIYAGRTITLSGHGALRKRKVILMHREILELLGASEGDHRDGNGLNNQRYNLRPATRSQNGCNQRKTHGKSRFKGVTWHEKAGKWQAQICFRVDRKLHTDYLGHFTEETEAAKAYDLAAKQRHKSFAHLNNV